MGRLVFLMAVALSFGEQAIAQAPIQIPDWARACRFDSIYEAENGTLQQAVVDIREGKGSFTLRNGQAGALFNIIYVASLDHPQMPPLNRPTPSLLGRWNLGRKTGYFVFREPEQNGLVDGYWGFNIQQNGNVITISNPRGSWDGILQAIPLQQAPPPPQVQRPVGSLPLVTKPADPIFANLPGGETTFRKQRGVKGGTFTGDWLDEAATLRQSVGRLFKSGTVSVGTCFMIGENIAMTSKHIIDSHGIDTDYAVGFPVAKRALPDSFELEGKPILVDPDICIFRLAPNPQKPWRKPISLPTIKGLTVNTIKPRKFKANDAIVIGFPEKDEQLVTADGIFKDGADLENTYIYDTATEPGSSGSPVFDFEWNLVAVHWGTPQGKNHNMGFQIEFVLLTLKAELEKTEEGRKILRDLKL